MSVFVCYDVCLHPSICLLLYMELSRKDRLHHSHALMFFYIRVLLCAFITLRHVIDASLVFITAQNWFHVNSAFVKEMMNQF